jgi:hypothetical protein
MGVKMNFKLKNIFDYFKVSIYYSENPEGKYLGKVELPLIEGYLVLKITVFNMTFTGYFDI